MKPMLARTVGPRFDRFPAFLQPKLNGVRCLWQNGVFQSRGGIQWKPTFFPHINEQLGALQLPRDAVLDGELYVHGWRLQRINSAVGVNNNQPNTDTPSIEYHIFDVVHPTVIFSERYLSLYQALKKSNLPHVRPVDTSFVLTWDNVTIMFNYYTSLNYEGVMLRPDGPYEFGEHPSRTTGNPTTYRSPFLWKHKSWKDGEWVCVGSEPGEGKASIGYGALWFSLPNGDKFKVGTGFTDEDRMLPPPIGRLCRIRYIDLTSDGKPFNASFIAVMN